ncbi:MAG: hypothetical protein A2X97_05605 [Bdellovibrionales bacterium GWA1_52_35]|nr:MAG: hypothetical protein A2X97_05605 [Bdellovibrionales bacterium GWA1_52_35]
MERLDRAGHAAFIVGGSVRDFFLGRINKDHDIATSASPEELCRIFPEAITVGKAFGVLKIPLAEGNGALFLEVATFREDLEYEDHRHPKRVRFAGPDEDASRRDFTINAMYFDPKTSRLLDPTGGMADLKARTVRAIGTPSLRFKEDALRLLRAIRFTAGLDFMLEENTSAAIREKARLIKHVSAERIRDELTLILTGPHPEFALELMMKLDLLRFVLPELEALKGVRQSPLYHPEGDAWVHTLKAMQFLKVQNTSRSSTLAWGTLLHDIGKATAAERNNGENFNGHELDGAKLALGITLRLKMSGEDSERIRMLVLEHLKFKDVFAMRESTLQRFIRQPHFPELLALHKADSAASDGNLAFYEFCRSRLEANLKNQGHNFLPKLVDGNDLIQLGLKPGPEFTAILRTIEDLALEHKIHTKEEALEYVIRQFVT